MPANSPVKTHTTLAHDPDVRHALSVGKVLFEYVYFEEPYADRMRQKQAFLWDQIEAPHYIYPKLRRLFADGGSQRVQEVESAAERAIATLERAVTDDSLDRVKLELFADYQASRLLRLKLLQSAWESLTAKSPAARRVYQQDFMDINDALFGPINETYWQQLLSAVWQETAVQSGASAMARRLQTELHDLLPVAPTSIPAQSVVEPDLLNYYGAVLAKRYRKVLEVVPKTDDEVIYDAEQCQAIMQRALAAGGLDKWRVRVSHSKLVPSTKSDRRTISLPITTARTASELRRLILHEQEVHARRGENALAHTKLPLLRGGTASYAAAEEGLGLFLELVISGGKANSALLRATDRYLTAGLISGLGDGRPKAARETFEILWRMFALRFIVDGQIGQPAITAARERAYGMIENAFRGTDYTSPGIHYSKLKIYHEGLLQNVAHLRSIIGDEAAFEELFLGKYNHTDARERERIRKYCNLETKMV